MRAALLIVLIAATAYAEPLTASELRWRAMEGATAEIRVDAAERLAIRFDRDADARQAALAAVLAGDAAVRKPIVQAMIDAGIVTPAAAAHIPTIGDVYRAADKLRVSEYTRRGSCTIVPGDPDAIRVTCSDADTNACVRSSITIETWPRPRRIAQSVKDIGRCGCVCCGPLDS